MFHLIVLVVIIVWFAKTAGDVGGNQITWSFIGAASFGVPNLAVMELAKLVLYSKADSMEAMYRIMGTASIVAVIAGVTVCFFVRKVLLAKQSGS